ncbi:hypothetical protein DNTS_020395 [Danionella cerebrum]|uniref:Diacylglycerol kinase n=1 Tax=Danionella cerebrum TaxID=2873325 RepID=A0A553QM90_9TELE|nr:hypothetical protein DNTS_020395 [Danionella translucida]
MAESSRVKLDSPSSSPGARRRSAQQSPGSKARFSVSGSPGHCFRKVTLTKPTFCHHCSDFIWGIVGFLCEVCNFMSHEKCMKHIRSVCSCMASTQVQVPVAHCFSPAGQKKRFCCVCRKHLEGSSALRCEGKSGLCELQVHSDCAIFTVSDCRVCHQDGGADLAYSHLDHHWREGVWSSGARCETCRRSCSSSDVLTAFRCQWCGITAHASCQVTVPPQCTLGRLQNMILHPSAVQICSRNFSKMHLYRISETSQHCDALDNLDDGDPQSLVASKESTAPPDSGRQTLRVFDGDDAVKRNQFRLVTIPRIVRNEEVVEAALRAFLLPDDAQDFELQNDGLFTDDIINRNGTPENKPVFKETASDSWLLRAKPRETEVMRIYSQWSRVGASYIAVTAGKSSTVDEMIRESLSLLGKQNENPDDFNLVEVFMSSKQVQRQVLSGHELLLDKLQEIRKMSLRQMNQTRFYLVENRNRVLQISHLVSISHVYTAQGAVVLQVSCFSEAERIYMLAKDTSVAGKQLYSLVIPEILHSHLSKESSPLLVFVNPKSGGLKGREILHGFRKLLNPHQVFELGSGGPLPGLHTFRDVPRFRILVCGGDGTVGWVLSIMESIRHKMNCKEPPISIIPLGTGNDLSRVFLWGNGYSGEDLLSVLLSVDEADLVPFDRWTILFDAQEVNEEPKIVQMNNYFGLGIDAELSLDFHQAREEDPDKFNSRFHNKGVYVKVGLQKLSHTRNLHKDLKLQVDNQQVELPSIEGLILLNIPSWGSGADLWGSDSDSRFEKPRMDDGMLEVVGVTGVVHMGQVQSGLRSGIRIAQGRFIRIIVSRAVPVQVDGEPWIQPPAHIIVSAAGPKVCMLRKSKSKQKKHSGKDNRDQSPAPSE